jgi:hypothetical protein
MIVGQLSLTWNEAFERQLAHECDDLGMTRECGGVVELFAFAIAAIGPKFQPITRSTPCRYLTASSGFTSAAAVPVKSVQQPASNSARVRRLMNFLTGVNLSAILAPACGNPPLACPVKAGFGADSSVGMQPRT